MPSNHKTTKDSQLERGRAGKSAKPRARDVVNRGKQKMRYRSDESRTQADGAIAWYAKWMGGPTLAKIENCRLENLQGDMRRTVTLTGEADSFFSIPAVCSIAGAKVRGYVTCDGEGNLVFRHTYY